MLLYIVLLWRWNLRLANAGAARKHLHSRAGLHMHSLVSAKGTNDWRRSQSSETETDFD
jgi:hypothetical protein